MKKNKSVLLKTSLIILVLTVVLIASQYLLALTKVSTFNKWAITILCEAVVVGVLIICARFDKDEKDSMHFQEPHFKKD